MERYTNEYNKPCYRGVKPETPFKDLKFYQAPRQVPDEQWALHTNMGSLTVLNRMARFTGIDGHGHRDIETGYRSPDGQFWLASGMCDVRKSGAVTMQEAIDWVKKHANNGCWYVTTQ
jgi:hypothetical protein